MRNSSLPIITSAREKYDITGHVFSSSDLSSLYREAQNLAHKINRQTEKTENYITPGQLITLYALRSAKQDVISYLESSAGIDLGSKLNESITASGESAGDMVQQYEILYSVLPPPEEADTDASPDSDAARAVEAETARNMGILIIDDDNPVLHKQQWSQFYAFDALKETGSLGPYSGQVGKTLKTIPIPWVNNENLFSYLTRPARLFPDNLSAQLEYIVKTWARFLSSSKNLLIRSMDFLKEEQRPAFPPGPGPTRVMEFGKNTAGVGGEVEYEAFSQDSDWMPNVVMLAKSTLVWLDQLSKQYGYEISRLDQIPDRELDIIAERGFTALWLIGLWERSRASRKIKQDMGNPEAQASAYSLDSYRISDRLGGQGSLENLKHRCSIRGIKLASDMVPNHTGIDSEWVIARPELFLSADQAPFPGYTYTGADLSGTPGVGIFLEDHYYDKTDAAVTFKRVDYRTGQEMYIYHGNDGTSMPWNDTAQLNYLNPETREMIIQTIIQVARDFPVIRFDAAMTLAKRHIQRLWYPRPGSGGDIPGRAIYAMEQEEFDSAIPIEFWREVVDRIAEEVPDTLLLAEAFWMMEGYFVRTLGMHRVYNSAFMNMLKMEENRKYRDTIKNTINFDPEILKRFVNFMNNPDEDTAIEQFGNGDKYLGTCTLLVTMPGLPMFGHGQVEGYREKYGMEYSRAYWDELPDLHLVEEHYRKIFPLMRRRYLFSCADNFALFDVRSSDTVHENIFAYTNGTENEKVLVLYNNSNNRAGGWIHTSAPSLKRISGDERRLETTQAGHALGLTDSPDCFAIFKGFHDNLTYVRPSSEFHSRGMYVELSGYESQVFWDIQEITDSDGSYKTLCEHLDGRGVADLELELKRSRLHALHSAAETACSTETLELIREMISGPQDSSEQAAKQVTKLFLDIGHAVQETWEEMKFPENSSLRGLSYVADSNAVKDAVLAVLHITHTSANSSTPLARYIDNSIKLMPEIPAILAAYFLCRPFIGGSGSEAIRNADFASDLLLNELLHDRLYEAGLDLDTAGRAVHAVNILMGTSGWFEVMKTETLTAAQQLQDFFANFSFRYFCGVNWSDGVEWYHKESMQDAFFWTAITALVDRPDLIDSVEEQQILYNTIITFLLKESKAAYRIGNLIE